MLHYILAEARRIFSTLCCVEQLLKSVAPPSHQLDMHLL
jgi:hypothetical protein